MTNHQDALRMALEACREKFVYYVEYHAAKGNGVKEADNQAMVGMINAALSAPLPKDAQEEREAFDRLFGNAINKADISAADMPAEVVTKLRGALWQGWVALSPSVRPVSLEGQNTLAWMVYDASDCEVLCTVYAAEAAKKYTDQGYRAVELIARHDATARSQEDVALARQIVEDTNATMREQAETMKAQQARIRELEALLMERSKEDVRKEAYHELYAALIIEHGLSGIAKAIAAQKEEK
jgi:hypothetical protein